MEMLTSGDTLRETIKILKNESSVRVAGIVVSVDRQEKGKRATKTARYEIEKDFDTKACSIVTLEDIINAMKNGVINAEHLEKMTRYKAEYGGNNV